VKIDLPTLVVVAFIGWSLAGFPLPNITVPDGPVPVKPVDPVDPVKPVKPAPSAELQAAVVPLVTLRSDTDAKVVSQAHQDFAWVLGRKPCQSSGELKARLAEFHAVLYQGTPLAGAIPGFSAAFEQSFTSALGSEDSALDASKQVAFVEAVAWALAP
jgi:hypothetical protein